MVTNLSHKSPFAFLHTEFFRIHFSRRNSSHEKLILSIGIFRKFNIWNRGKWDEWRHRAFKGEKE
jgi:DNA-binding transcriptional regulator/RsmH inhibitor MraZ